MHRRSGLGDGHVIRDDRPLSHGVTAIVDQGEFDARRWYTILEEQEVTIWYTAPTAIRMLMRAGPEAVEGHDLSKLRFIASVGEPLGADAVRWGEEVLGRPIHDNWWQTETGGIMIANYAAMDIRPGSMGRPVPGIEAAILRHDADGLVLDHDGQACRRLRARRASSAASGLALDVPRVSP